MLSQARWYLSWYLSGTSGSKEIAMRVTLTSRSLPKLVAPAGGQVDYFDKEVPGFGLRVSANGARSWIVLYRRHGKKRRVTLGPENALSLADARAKAKDMLARVRLGEDPAAERRAAREATTFSELVAAYTKYAATKMRSRREEERMLAKYPPASWRDFPAKELHRRDIRELVEGIAAEGAPIMANRVLACFHRVFNFGIRRELVETNPCAMIERPGTEKSRDRVLSADELRRVWKALDGEDAGNAALFKLFLFTAQRGYELRTMRWEDLDLDTGWWTIPAERAKNGKAHRVPLAPPVVAILRELEAVANESGERRPFVFTSPRAKDGHRTTLTKAAKRLREASGVDFIPHDIRRTVASHLASVGVQRLTISKLLNHAERGITAVYERHSYDAEKQAALNAWAVRLEQIVSGERAHAKVVAFARA
jgi:integrase